MSEVSYSLSNYVEELDTKKEQKDNKKKNKRKILNLIIMITTLILIIIFSYLRKNIDTFSEKYFLSFYEDNKLFYFYLIDFVSTYKIIILIYVFGFCQWNIYKSVVMALGNLLCYYIIFVLKLILKTNSFTKHIDYIRNNSTEIIISDEYYHIVNKLASGYSCPSLRSTLIIFAYLSFVELLFKEKNFKRNRICKYIFYIIFIIIIIIINWCMILFLLNSASNVLVGTLIGFIIYFIMFQLLRIDYDRSDQMIQLLKIKIIYYLLINIIMVFIVYIIYLFDSNPNDDIIPIKTFLKSLCFTYDITMIISLKLLKDCYYKSDSIFISRNFLVDEILDEDNLFNRISNEEIRKWDKRKILNYLYRCLICLVMTGGCALLMYLISLIFESIENEKGKKGASYFICGLIYYLLPFHLLMYLLFFISKVLFHKFKLIDNEYENV